MTLADLLEILAAYNMKIDGAREGAGRYRDLEIGIGAERGRLHDLCAELTSRGLTAKVRIVNNAEHPDFGSVYLELSSFWCE